MRCRNYSMFHHFHPLRLEWCQKFDTNPCQSLALKDVNLRQICRRATRSGVPMPPWLGGVFQDETVAGLHCPRGFILRTSTSGHRRMHGSRTEPSSCLHHPGLRSVDSEDVLRKWVEIAMENGEIRVDQCSKTSMFILFPRVLVSTCQY